MSHTIHGTEGEVKHPPEYIPLAKALRRIGSPSPVTVWRWTRKGIRGIRLQAWLIGGRWFTTAEAVDAFIAATTAAANGESESPQARESAASRRNSVSQAERECVAAGL